MKEVREVINTYFSEKFGQSVINMAETIENDASRRLSLHEEIRLNGKPRWTIHFQFHTPYSPLTP
jgi:hypothetical protein